MEVVRELGATLKRVKVLIAEGRVWLERVEGRWEVKDCTSQWGAHGGLCFVRGHLEANCLKCSD